MAGPIVFRGLLYTAFAIISTLSGRPSPAESLRLVTNLSLGPFENLSNDKAPGFSVEVLRQVFAAMGQDASFEAFPLNRSLMMIVRGEADGIFSEPRASALEPLCVFPDEPLKQEKWVFFIRTADIGRLTFSSFDDLVGHDVAVREPIPGLLEQATVSSELWNFLRAHENVVETSGGIQSLRMLAAGRVDYAVVNLTSGLLDIAAMGLSGKIAPLVSKSVIGDGIYICFSKARVSPAFVEAFSHALKQFKQTEAFHAIYRKYFP